MPAILLKILYTIKFRNNALQVHPHVLNPHLVFCFSSLTSNMAGEKVVEVYITDIGVDTPNDGSCS